MHPLLLTKMLPISQLPPNLGVCNLLTNPDTIAHSNLNWMVSHLTWRNAAIWDYNPYTVESLAATPSPHEMHANSNASPHSFATTPATESTCYHGNPNCPSYVANWLNPDSTDTELLCDALCNLKT